MDVALLQYDVASVANRSQVPGGGVAAPKTRPKHSIIKAATIDKGNGHCFNTP